MTYLTHRMSFYVAPSMIAMKYQRQPFVGAPLQPGQRLSVAREMETSVRYYGNHYKNMSSSLHFIIYLENHFNSLKMVNFDSKTKMFHGLLQVCLMPL